MILDTKGLRCPLPVLRARRALKEVSPGDTLTVVATDPGAVKDFEMFCAATGCQMVSMAEENGVFTFDIRKPE